MASECALTGHGTRQMKIFQAILCGLLFHIPGAMAADADGSFALKGAGLFTCERLVAERENRTNAYFIIGGWLEGYISGHNRFTEDTYDVMPFESLEMFLRVMETHCRANPQDRLYEVTNSLLTGIADDRLQSNSPRLRITVGERNTVIYQETIRRIQRKLVQSDIYKGNITGDFDDETRAALAAYQTSVELEATGFPGQPTLWRLFRPAPPANDAQ